MGSEHMTCQAAGIQWVLNTYGPYPLPLPGPPCLIHQVSMPFSLHYEDTGGGPGMEEEIRTGRKVGRLLRAALGLHKWPDQPQTQQPPVSRSHLSPASDCSQTPSWLFEPRGLLLSRACKLVLEGAGQEWFGSFQNLWSSLSSPQSSSFLLCRPLPR